MAGQVSDAGVSCTRYTGSPTSRWPWAAPSTGTSSGSTRRCGTAWRGRARFALAGVGIDSWGVDYGLLDASGALLGNPVHYRDARTDGMPARVTRRCPPPSSTRSPASSNCRSTRSTSSPRRPCSRTPRAMLLIPDLLAYWLTGETGAEITNASTTSLLDVRAQAWATEVIREDGAPAAHLPAAAPPGRGHRPGHRDRTGWAPRFRSSRSALTTRRRPWRVPAAGPDSPIFPRGPGRWPGWSSTPGADRGEPPRQLHQGPGSTARSATCAT